ncbi:alpha/beta fold hydrolase [Georgenia alba]|uniref:Alpha/beta fold hydrolase n=1 Tax=Georgenia alba TaxID=2233858 RepID=A0ABW2Q8H6_9MICO
MPSVTSQDGTRIAYEHRGEGPTVVLVGGALDDGAENAGLLEALEGWTVCTYSRRGRGRSGNSPAYAVEREIEDLAALVEALGPPAHLFGASSGGALVLRAVAAGFAVARVAVYEVPYMVDEGMVQVWGAYRRDLAAALDDGRHGDAVALFMGLAGASPEDVAGARASEYWPQLEAVAPTLAHDAACLGDGVVPVELLGSIDVPVLVATGAVLDPVMGGLQPGFFDDAAEAITTAVPRAERAVVPGTGHRVDPARLAPVLDAFYRG